MNWMSNTPLLAVILNGLPPYRLHVQRRLARELSGWRVHTLLTHEGSEISQTLQQDDAIGLVRFGQGESVAIQSAWHRQLAEWRKGGRIIRWLRENPPAAVLVSTYNDLGRLRIIRWCHRRQIPVFLAGDSNILLDYGTGVKALLKQKLMRWIIQRCTGLLPFGRLGRDYFLKYGAAPERIFYFPCEPDYSLFALPATAEQLAQARLKYSLSAGRRYLLYSGRLATEKRVDLLVAAFAAVATNRPDWDLVIAGDGPCRQQLQAQIARSGMALGERIHFLGMIAAPDELVLGYQLCEVLVLPSDYEPWGLVVNEAAAAGLALVCSDVVGAGHELLQDGINGRLFVHGREMELAAVLGEVTESVNQEKMKGQSREILQQWRKIADPVRGLEEALKSGGAIS